MKIRITSGIFLITITSFLVSSSTFHVWRLSYLANINTSLKGVCASISPYLQIGSSRWARELAEGSIRASYPDLKVDFSSNPTDVIASTKCEVPGLVEQNFSINLENGAYFRSLLRRTFVFHMLTSFLTISILAVLFRYMSIHLAQQIGQAWRDRFETAHNFNGTSWSGQLLSLIPGIDHPRLAIARLNNQLESEVSRAASLQAALLNRRAFSKYLHDIRSPVGALQIVMQKNRSKFDKDENSLLDQILVRLKEIPEVVLQVEKNASKDILKEIHLVDFQEILQITIDRLNLEFGNQCHISVDFQGEETQRSLRISASDMDRVITNLCVNAKNAGASDIRINVRLSPAILGIDVNDSGKGGLDLSASSESAEGYGLGIEIVREILLASKAKMSVSSPLGKGTKIALAFPTS
jgi:signal transduction histidine kinase